MRSIDRFESVIGKVHEMAAHHYDETLPLGDMLFHSLTRMSILLFTCLLRVPGPFRTGRACFPMIRRSTPPACVTWGRRRRPLAGR